MYGKDVEKVVAANTSNMSITIRSGTAVAEFHPRPRTSMNFLPQSTESKASIDQIGTAALSVTRVSDARRQATSMSTEPQLTQADPLVGTAPRRPAPLLTRDQVGTLCATAPLVPSGREGGNDAELSHGKETAGPCSSKTMATQSTEAPDESSWEADFHIDPLKSVDLSHLDKECTVEEQRKLRKLLWDIRGSLSEGTLDFTGDATVPHNTTCRIETTTENPNVTSVNRSSDPAGRQLFAEMTSKALKQGIIEPSKAPWSSNAVLVKKDGKTRMVIDYRSLNKLTVKDAYPMPKVQDLMDLLKGTKWFTGIDCVQAFHQIPMADERSKDLTTFRGPGGGLFRYRYMPMGLVNAMAVWSRFIDNAMSEYQYDCVLCYADDLLIYTKSDSVDDHISDVRKVVARLKEHGIMIKASKMKLACKQMPFLGVIITEHGMVPNPEKTKAIRLLQPAKTLAQLRRHLGMFAYYRKFIYQFSKIAQPLYDMTKKPHLKKKGTLKFSPEALASFEQLKEAICSEPIIHYPDWDQPFEIHTDASGEALAAILTQKLDGIERVIMYASKSLNDVEKKYQAYEQECLAVVWAAELFRKYIRNSKTIVRTDCAALQWLHSRKVGARVMRWVLRLQEFDLDIRHRKGKDAVNVDPLSREMTLGEDPYGGQEAQIEKLYTSMQKNFSDAKKLSNPDPQPKKKKKETVLVVGKEEEPAKASYFKCKEDKEATSRQDFINEQKAEESRTLSRIRELIDKPPEGDQPIMFRRNADGLIVMQDGKKRPRVVVPESLRKCVLKAHHNSQLAGHQGSRRTFEQIAASFYWPGMAKDVKLWVRACLACAKRKTPRPKRAGLREVKQSTYPGQTIAIDIWGPMMESPEGNKWVLTMIDHFTKWPVAVPIPDHKAETIAKAILRHWVCEHGVPESIVSDQGRELISKGIQQMCDNLGTAKIATAGYNPTGNATVERFHRYMGAALCIIYEMLPASVHF